jgi:MraZ protein
MFSSGSEADLDKQGRVTIPAGLLKKASLARDVVVVGVGDHLEVWDRKAWQDEIEDVEGRVELVAERVAARER